MAVGAYGSVEKQPANANSSPPDVLNLAIFSGAIWITASYIAQWWRAPDSPTVFWPFMMAFIGVGQTAAGVSGFRTRDNLFTLVNTMWGSFWLCVGLSYALNAHGAIDPHEIHAHYPELASWFVVLTIFTWSCALAATAKDLVLVLCLGFLGIGSTAACAAFAFDSSPSTVYPNAVVDEASGSVTTGIKVASYFWMLSAVCAWYRVTVYLLEETYGSDHPMVTFFPVGGKPLEMPSRIFGQASTGEKSKAS